MQVRCKNDTFFLKRFVFSDYFCLSPPHTLGSDKVLYIMLRAKETGLASIKDLCATSQFASVDLLNDKFYCLTLISSRTHELSTMSDRTCNLSNYPRRTLFSLLLLKGVCVYLMKTKWSLPSRLRSIGKRICVLNYLMQSETETFIGTILYN